MKIPSNWEKGLTANCWLCEKEFVKKYYCQKCGYYKCPSCQGCGCNLEPKIKAAMDKTFKALKPIFEAYNREKRKIERIYKQMIQLEYILDATNQKRKRKDKEVYKAWGYAFNTKGLVIELLDYYQPTLLMMMDKYARNKCNPTWTKRAKNVYEITQKAKRAET